MSEREKGILEKLAKALPEMNERQQGRLLGYGEAVLDMRGGKKDEQTTDDHDS